METTIRQLQGRQLWDSRGRPTVEVEVTLAGGASGRALAPAGASTGSGEAVDLRDGGELFGGYGASRAVANVNTEIAGALTGLDVREQARIDQTLVELDGTDNRSRLGGNAMIATSMAVAHAAAAGSGLPLVAISGRRSGYTACRCRKCRYSAAVPTPRDKWIYRTFMVVPFGADQLPPGDGVGGGDLPGSGT